MILHKSENVSNQSLMKELPIGNIKALFIKFNGTHVGATAAALADLGTIRVNYRQTDIINTSMRFFSRYANLNRGVAEFTSTGGAGNPYTSTIYIPFHALWDEQNGLPVSESDVAFIELRFSALAALSATGVVEIYYIPAKAPTTYVPLFIQQNIQAGGASKVVDRFYQFNVSSLYIDENANLTDVLLYRDGRVVINAPQSVLKSYSNYRNEVETAIDLIQIDLNPNQILSNALSNQLEANMTVTGATALVITYFALWFSTGRLGTIQVGNVGGGKIIADTAAMSAE